MKINKSEIKILKTNMRFLRFQTVWPAKNNEVHRSNIFYIKHFLRWLSTSIMWFGVIGHFVVGLIENRPINLDMDLAFVVSLTGTYLFNFFFVINIKPLTEIYTNLSDLETFGKPRNFDKEIAKLNRQAMYHFYYMFSAAIAYTASPLMEYKQCMENNQKYNIPEPCGLTAVIWSPFDIRPFPILQLLGCYEIYSGWFSYVTSSFISFTIRESIKHITIRLRHCREMFLEALKEDAVDLRRNKFHKCIKYHNFIIKMAERMDKSFRSCMFIHVVLTGAILGISGYRFIRSSALNTLAILIGWFMSLIFVCSVAEELIEESSNVGAAILAQTNWQEFDLSLQKDLVMVIMRSQKVINLHAGPFGDMTFATIVAILKTSYSFFALMNQSSN